MPELIYKICGDAEWNRARQAGEYKGSADDLRDGFIHFSRAHQLRATALKYFANRTDLVLIAVDPQDLGPALKHEPSRNNDLFPHLYAPLPLSHVRWHKPLPWSNDQHQWPKDLQLDP